MAITFLEQQKKMKSMIPVLVMVIVITGFVLWWGFLREEEEVIFEETVPESLKKVDINFQILRDFDSQEFQSFEPIPVFEGEEGRENPFVPY